MAYPYSSPAANKADATVTATDHPAHHNTLANALIDLLAELGSGPKGGSADLTARLSALDTTVSGKQPLDADLTSLAAGGATATTWLRALLDAVYDAAGAAATAQAASQPLDADLTAIAALVTTAYGRGLLTDADATAFTARLTGLLNATYVSSTIITGYGAVSGGADCTTAIQAAIDAGADAAAAAGTSGFEVWVPEGQWFISQIETPTGCVLRGVGYGSELKQLASTTGHMLVLAGDTTIKVCVRDLTLHGNSTAQSAANDCINFDQGAEGSLLPNHRLLNLRVRMAKGNGITLGYATRASIVNNVNIYQCDGFGLLASGADSQYSNIDVGQSGLDGVAITGSALTIDNVKSWYSGRIDNNGAGFLIAGSNIVLTNAFSQENMGHGFEVFKSGTVIKGLVLSGISDGDNRSAGTKSGVYLYNVTRGLVRVAVTAHSGAAGAPAYGLFIGGGSTGCDVSVTIGEQTSTILNGASTVAGNRVAINGEDWSATDFTLPTGAVAQSHDRSISGNADLAALVSGRLFLVGVYLRAGQVISSITFVSGATPLATGSNQWFSLYSAALVPLKVTADDTSTAWAASTAKTLTLSGGSYTVPTSGMYYLGCTVVATTVPTLRGAAGASAIAAIAPVLHGSSTTGLTNPASAPNPAAALNTTGNARPWCYCS